MYNIAYVQYVQLCIVQMYIVQMNIVQIYSIYKCALYKCTLYKYTVCTNVHCTNVHCTNVHTVCILFRAHAFLFDREWTEDRGWPPLGEFCISASRNRSPGCSRLIPSLKTLPFHTTYTHTHRERRGIVEVFHSTKFIETVRHCQSNWV